MKLINTTIATTLLAFLLSSSAFADCSYELFSISSTKDTKIIDFVEQLSDECEFSIIVTDPFAEEYLATNLNNLTIDEVLNIVLKENNLSYTLENNILKISYLNTKMLNIDYILSQRKGLSSTDITLSSEGAGSTSTTSTGSEDGSTGGGSAGRSGMKIESSDEVIFWHELDLELQMVLNRPEDTYKADAPIINKNAGIVTVTATLKQINRLEEYLEKLQNKVKKQVLIDVKLLSVTMDKGKTTGVDWQQLYSLQNLDISLNKIIHKSVSEITDDKATELIIGDSPTTNTNLLSLYNVGKLNEVVKFLKTQGDVSSISNPKVLTLNNQPALITVGTEFFYKITRIETLASSGSGTQSSSDDVQSVFAGVLLDITPEISDNDTITLKINPSLSEAVGGNTFVTEASVDRTMPPDLVRRQLSSVVTIKNGNRIILGGLINTSNSIVSNRVPLLGSIPGLKYLFSYENKIKKVTELVIVIEAHIINKNNNDLSLSDLGYEALNDEIVMNNKKTVSGQTNKLLNNSAKVNEKIIKKEENER